MQFKQILIGYLSWIRYKIDKKYRQEIEKIAKKRINICNSCPLFIKFTRQCSLCGCFMNIKTKMIFELDENNKSINGCLEKKW